MPDAVQPRSPLPSASPALLAYPPARALSGEHLWRAVSQAQIPDRDLMPLGHSTRSRVVRLCVRGTALGERRRGGVPPRARGLCPAMIQTNLAERVAFDWLWMQYGPPCAKQRAACLLNLQAIREGTGDPQFIATRRLRDSNASRPSEAPADAVHRQVGQEVTLEVVAAHAERGCGLVDGQRHTAPLATGAERSREPSWCPGPPRVGGRLRNASRGSSRCASRSRRRVRALIPRWVSGRGSA